MSRRWFPRPPFIRPTIALSRGAAQAPTFDPSLAGEPAFWYDFAHGRTVSDGRITELANRVNGGSALSLVSGSSGPLLDPSGAALFASDANNALQVSGFGQSNPNGISAMMLRFRPDAEFTSSTTGQAILGWGSGSLALHLGAHTSGIADEVVTVTPVAGNHYAWNAPEATVTAAWHTLSTWSDGADWRVFLDGEDIGTFATGTHGYIAQVLLTVGRRGSGANAFAGLIGEIVAWRQNFSPAQRATLEAALANKWK